MNNSMNILRRLMAFLLVLLLVTTMVGDDFYAMADGEVITEEGGGGDSGAAPEESGGGEYTAPDEGGGDYSAGGEEGGDYTPDDGGGDLGDAGLGDDGLGDGSGGDSQEYDENGNPIVNDPANPDLNTNNDNNNTSGDEQEVNNNANNTPENIDNNKDGEDSDLDNPDNKDEEDPDAEKDETEENKPKQCDHDWSYSSNGDGTHTKTCSKCGESVTESCTLEDGTCIHCGYTESADKECEHEWTYVSNGDGTHTKICELCGESVTEDCEFDEDGVCIHCGYSEEELCEHEEYEYISNGDGTHIKRCKKCGTEEIEDCEFDEDGVCIHCGYIDPNKKYKLVYTRISKTIDGVVITVKGDMPEGATVDIQPVNLDYAENLLDAVGKEDNVIFRAYDITIYDADGNKYQPQKDGKAVEITVSGVSELNEVDDDTVEVLRMEEDQSVTTLDSVVNGEEVVFESEHFSVIFISAELGTSEEEFTVPANNMLATSAKNSDATKYYKVNTATVSVFLEEDDERVFTAKLRRNNSSLDSYADGDVIISEEKDRFVAPQDGWYDIVFDFSSVEDGYIAPNTYYSVQIEGFEGRDHRVKCGKDSSLIYISSDGDAQAETGAVVLSMADPVEAPDDVKKIKLESSTHTNEVYSETGFAAHFEGEIYYLVGETDTLTAQLTNNYTRKLTWSLESVAGSSNAVTLGTSGSFVGSTNTLSANSAGIMKLTVQYSNSVYGELTIHVLQPYFAEGSYDSSKETYTQEYANKAWEPTVGLYDVSNSYTKSSGSSVGYIRTLEYANNENAGTATVTVKFTTSHSITYNYTVNFTITKKALTWDENFADAEFTVDTDSNTVTALSGAKAGINNSSGTDIGLNYKKSGKKDDVTITLSDKSYSTSGITYTMKITAGESGNYSVNISKEYTVVTTAKDINDYVEVHWKNDETPVREYTGSDINIITGMEWGTDFIFYYKGTSRVATFVTEAATTVSYEKDANDQHRDVGTWKVYFAVTGYGGQLELPYEIEALSITPGSLTVNILNEDGTSVTSGYAKYTRTGSPITPDAFVTASGTTEDYITVSYGATALTKGKDYTISYATGTNINIGTATVIITGMGNYSGSDEAYFTITASYVDDAVIEVGGSSYKAKASNNWVSGYTKNYTGDEASEKPSVTVYLNGTKLTDVDYTLAYSDTNEANGGFTADAGTKYVVCTGKGKYVGKVISASYVINPINIETNSLVELNQKTDSVPFTGSEVEFTDPDNYEIIYTSLAKTNKLALGTDYDISFTDRINAGTVTYTITGTGKNYQGTKKGTFTITPVTLTKAMISLEYDEHAYTGDYLTPKVTVSYNSWSEETTTSTSNFSVSYTNNQPAGTAVVTVTPKGNFSGDPIPVNFTITTKNIEKTIITLNGAPIEKDSHGNYYCTGYNPLYVGTSRIPDIMVMDGSTTLRKGNSYDYTILAVNNTNVAVYEYYAQKGTEETFASHITIVGKNNYNGTSITIYFDIKPRNIEADTVAKTVSDALWNETESKFDAPTVSVIDNGTDLKSSLRGKELTVNTDYTITGDTAPTTAGGNYSITVTGSYNPTESGKGNYTGTETIAYSAGKDISTAEVVLTNPYKTGDASIFTKSATGKYQVDYIGQTRPVATVTLKINDTTTKTLVAGTDYLVDGTDTDHKSGYTSATGCADTYNSYDGTNTVKVVMVGTNGYYGTCTYFYDIVPVDIKHGGEVTPIDPVNTFNLPYTGAEINIEPTYDSQGANTNKNAASYKYTAIDEPLVYKTDYTIDKATVGPTRGEYTLTITGKGNYNGTTIYKYVIKAGELGSISIRNDEATVYQDPDDPTKYFVYWTGNSITIDDYITVKNTAGTTLNKGTDYRLSYDNNTAVGTATVTATGVGNYSDTSTQSKDFSIKTLKASDFEVTFDKEAYYPYTGSQIIPKVTVVYVSGGVRTPLTEYDATTGKGDYTLDYGTNIYPGTVNTSADNWVKITGKGVYSGDVTKKFNVYLELKNLTRDTSAEYPTMSSSLAKVVLDNTSYNAGEEPKAKVYYIYNSTPTEITEGTPVTVTPTISPGSGTVTVTGNTSDDNYVTGSVIFTAIPFKADLSDGQGTTYYSDYMTLPAPGQYPYTGEEFKPTVTDKCGGVAGTDYTVTYLGTTSTNSSGTVTIIDPNDHTSAGQHAVKIEAESGSTYYKYGTSVTLIYYIKYDLNEVTSANGRLVLTADGTPAFTYNADGDYFSTSYTGTARTYSVSLEFGTAGSTKTLTSKTTPGKDYFTVDDDGLNAIGTKHVSISVSAAGANYVMGGPAQATVKITGIDISTKYIGIEQTIGAKDYALTGGHYPYTGSEVHPGIIVKESADGTTIDSSCYTVEYHEATSVSTTAKPAYVVITGREDKGYSGSKTIYYYIDAKDIADCTVKIDTAYYAGGVAPVRPKVTVKNGNTSLVENTDYTVEYASNIGPSTNGAKSAYVIIKAVDGGNYTGTIPYLSDPENKVHFAIEKLNFESEDVALVDKDGKVITDDMLPLQVDYTGGDQSAYDLLNVVLTNPYYKEGVDAETLKTVTLKSQQESGDNADYHITVYNAAGNEDTINAMGVYTLKVTGMNSCEKTKIITVEVAKRSLEDNFHYYYVTGSGFVGTWRYSTDLYGDGSNKAGYYARGKLNGDEDLEIFIEDVINVTVGSQNVPTVRIKDNGAYDQSLTPPATPYELTSSDFTLSVSNANDVGTAAWQSDPTDDKHALVASTSPSVTITGQRNYTGSITLPFNIGKNINTMGLVITYTESGNPNTYMNSYDPLSSDFDSTHNPLYRWSVDYDATSKVPSVTVQNSTGQYLAENIDYTISYQDMTGAETDTINAGYKVIVVTGKGNYCGSMGQLYAINKRKIDANSVTLTNEPADEMVAKNGDNVVLKFSISGNAVTRLSAKDAVDYLYNEGEGKVKTAAQAEQFADYYYAVYNGEDIKPTVKVWDVGLGSIEINESDLKLDYDRENQVSDFTYSGDNLNTYFSYVTITFAGSQDLNAPGNYYVSDAAKEFKIAYIIVQDKISSDFIVEFANALDGNNYNYLDGNAIPIELNVYKNTTYLTKNVDYTVEIKNKTYTNEDGTTFTLPSNIVPGEGTLVVTGKGNYQGSKTLTFNVLGNMAKTLPYHKDDEGNYISGAGEQQYTGTSITYGDPRIYMILPAHNAQLYNYILTAGTDYVVDESKCSSPDGYTNVGYVGYTGHNSYWDGSTDAIRYTIKFDEKNVKITGLNPDTDEGYWYTGYDIIPDLGINISTAVIERPIVFKRDGVEITNVEGAYTELGTITFDITYTIGSDTRRRTISGEYNIIARPMDQVTVQCNKTNYRYTGRAATPALTAYVDSTNLITGDPQRYKLTKYDATTQSGDYIPNYKNPDTQEDYIYGPAQFTISAANSHFDGTSDPVVYNIALQPVANLHVTGTTDNSISLQWVSDTFSNGTRLYVYKQNSDGTYGTEPFAYIPLPKKTNTYTITGLSSDTYYKILAYAYVSDEIISSEKKVEKNTGIAAKDITVVSNKAGQVTITWNSSEDGMMYYIYRSKTDGGTGTLCAIIPKAVGIYTNPNLTSGDVWYYYVEEYTRNSSGELELINTSSYHDITVM